MRRQACCLRGRCHGHAASGAIRRRAAGVPMVHDTSSNAEQQVNTNPCHPCVWAGLSFTANSDKWAQHDQINACLAHEQPLLKAPDTILDSCQYLTITSQQTIGTATGKSSLASSLLCSGFFMNTAGSSGGLQQQPRPGRAAQPLRGAGRSGCSHLPPRGRSGHVHILISRPHALPKNSSWICLYSVLSCWI